MGRHPKIGPLSRKKSCQAHGQAPVVKAGLYVAAELYVADELFVAVILDVRPVNELDA